MQLVDFCQQDRWNLYSPTKVSSSVGDDRVVSVWHQCYHGTARTAHEAQGAIQSFLRYPDNSHFYAVNFGWRR